MPNRSLNNQNKRITSTLITGLLIAIIIAYLGYFLYGAAKQSSDDEYFIKLSRIQEESITKLNKIGPYLRQFVAVPKEAKKSKPRFQKAVKIISATIIKLSNLNPPGKYKNKHKVLLGQYKDALDTYNDLYETADYVILRDSKLNKLIKELKYFANSISKSKSNKKAMAIALKARKNILSTKDELKAIESPIKIFDNSVLDKYILSLTGHLKQLEKALSNNDATKVQTALYDIQVDYSNNWQKAFLLSDKSAIQKYDRKIENINKITK